MAAAAAPAAIAAQSPAVLLARGVEAYRALEYERAITLLRNALNTEGLTPPEMASAWTYAGASHVFLEEKAPADSAFIRALQTAPAFRPDPLIFPPEVTEAFERVRRRTRFIQAHAPRDTTLPQGARWHVQLVVSAPHMLTAELTRPDGTLVRQLFSGLVRDSVNVGWDGRNSDGEFEDGRLHLVVASDGTETPQVPLQIEATRAAPDTLIPPPPPSEPASGTESWRSYLSLAGGLAAGLLVVSLPELISEDQRGRSARFVVGATLGGAGVLGFLAQRQDAPAIATAAGLSRDQWQRETDRIRAENAARKTAARLRITVLAKSAR